MVEPSPDPAPGDSRRAPHDLAIDEARALLGDVERELRAIEQAIARLEQGTYSTCEVCGSPIEPERLVDEPTGRRCGAHGAPD
jgi:RNA polymerase-binding transcription factor DksA